jgi:hypothetical protein
MCGLGGQGAPSISEIRMPARGRQAAEDKGKAAKGPR